MNLITEEQRLRMLANFENEGPDHAPVVKLFCPWGAATWLLTEMKTGEEDILFGLCDLGLGVPELGYVSRAEVEAITGPGGLKIERDIHFRPATTLSVYTRAVRIAQQIVDEPKSLLVAYQALVVEAREDKKPLRALLLNQETGEPVSPSVFSTLFGIR